MTNQSIFVPRFSGAILYREIQSDGGGLQYVEGPTLLRDFHVGSISMVGSRRARTFGSDYITTSNVIRITEVKEGMANRAIHIHFRTRNTPYVLVVSPESVTYNRDLGKLIDLTQSGDIDSDEWLTEFKLFKEHVDYEYKKSRIKQEASRKASGEAKGEATT